MKYLLRLFVLLVPLCLSMPAFAEELDEAQPVESIQADVLHGKDIFDSICAHCHRIDYEASAVGAPGLRGVLERHSVAWVESWITSPEAFAKVDETAKDLAASNPYGLVMPTIPEMQFEQNRKDVIEYLKTLK